MRPIDADELKRGKYHPLPYPHITPSDVEVESYKRGWNDAIDAIVDDAPTVDAVEVVRCKDCKWFGKAGCAINIVDDSDRPKETDYCSFGERAEE